MRSLFNKIAFSLLVCMVFFLFLELMARIFIVEKSYVVDNKTKKMGFYDSVLAYHDNVKRLKPGVDVTIKNHNLTGRDILFRTNSFGFRGPELGRLMLERSFKVLFFGDSITLENYLLEDETYLGMLQARFTQEKNKQDVCIVNGGIWDAGVQEEYAIFEEKTSLLKPQLVIINFYLNDSRPSWGFDREKRLEILKFLQNSRLISYLYSRFAVQSYLTKNKLVRQNFRFGWIQMAKNNEYVKDKKSFFALAKAANLDWGAAWEDSSWPMVEKYLAKMKKVAEEKNIQLAVVCFPVSFQVYADFLENTPQEKLKNICQSMGIDYLDLLPVFRGHKDQALFYDHCHPNIEGNKLIARELYTYVNERTPRRTTKTGVAQ